MKPVSILLSILIMSCAATHSKTSPVESSFDKEGHRGCRGLMPENTIPAMIKAIDLGVTTLEMDVVITADSQVLVSHEPFFNHEITTKPDGSFVTEQEEQSLNIYKMTYAETNRFDVGLKPHPRFPRQQKIAVHKPLLADMIDNVEQYIKVHGKKPVAYNIETKTTAATDGIYHPAPEVFVRLLMQVLAQKNILEKVIIQSFDVRTLQVLHNAYPAVKTALLVEPGNRKNVDEQLKNLGFTPDVYSPDYSLVTAPLVKQCLALKMKLLPWTVNNLAAIEELKKLGVDGVISDYPDLFAETK